MSPKGRLAIPEQMRQLLRGTEQVLTPAQLAQRLEESADGHRPLRVKLGLDPTAPDIHLGHTVQLRKLRQFQDFGHKAVLIIGDYTARIGDPSGQNVTRPMLSNEEIRANAQTYLDQAGSILDTSEEKMEARCNSEWLQKLSFAEILKLAAQVTVARMMERDTFELRFRDGVPIGVHEFLYPLMQAYDSVCVEADVELGGSDQTFNNLCGRDIQRAYGQKPQIVMMMPMLVGLDGREKMSKTKGNYIGVTFDPTDMFGKVMSLPDELLGNYFTLLTDLPDADIAELLDADKTHPRQAKARLAETIVATHHGAEAARAAAAEFDRVYRDGQQPVEMPEVRVPPGPIGIVKLIMVAGFAASNSEARRLIAQSAVSIDAEKITDRDAAVAPADGQVLRVGRRRFGRIVVR